MLKKICFAMIATATSLAAVAQTASPTEEKASVTTISGSADAYYRYDFGKSASNNLTSFTNSHNSFELGMASVKLQHSTGKVSVVADLGFGKRAQEFSYNDAGIMAAVKQLYVTYSPATWLKFTAGSWATHVGYELVDANANRNYSMSYMFTNGPFFHTGLRADLTKGIHGFMIGVANPTDFKTAPPTGINKKAVLAQYSLAASDEFKVYLNFVGGQSYDSAKSKQYDVVITSKLSDMFSLGVNATMNRTKFWEDEKFMDSKNWWGTALYLNLDPKSWFGLTLREEYFSDKNGLKVFTPTRMNSGNSGTIFASTLSANFKVNSFTIIPEFRVDKASKDIFVNKDGGAKGSNPSVLLAAVYSF
jgi:hypothetical protein